MRGGSSSIWVKRVLRQLLNHVPMLERRHVLSFWKPALLLVYRLFKARLEPWKVGRVVAMQGNALIDDIGMPVIEPGLFWFIFNRLVGQGLTAFFLMVFMNTNLLTFSVLNRKVFLLKIRRDGLCRCRLFAQFESWIQQWSLVSFWKNQQLFSFYQAGDIHQLFLWCVVFSALFEKCEVGGIPVLLHVARVHVFKITEVVAALWRDFTAVTLLRRVKNVGLLTKEDVTLVLNVLHYFRSCTAIFNAKLWIKNLWEAWAVQICSVCYLPRLQLLRADALVLVSLLGKAIST